MSDEQEEALRQSMSELRDAVSQADTTARQLPPLWQAKEWGLCESCGVERTRICKRVEGREVLICGACALKEMDEWEAANGPDSQKR